MLRAYFPLKNVCNHETIRNTLQTLYTQSFLQPSADFPLRIRRLPKQGISTIRGFFMLRAYFPLRTTATTKQYLISCKHSRLRGFS